MVKILLNRGKWASLGLEALIDDEDLELVEAHGPWYAHKVKTLKNGEPCFYAWSAKGGYMHRLITGAGDAEEVDHENHNRLDNRRQNLRKGTASQNNMNRLKQEGMTSDFMGVCLDNGSYLAQIQIDGKCRYISRHKIQRHAALARDQFVRQNPAKCSMATLNFPDNYDYTEIVYFRDMTSSGGLHGVSFKAGRDKAWRARRMKGKKEHCNGSYFTREEAALASDHLEYKLRGEGGTFNYSDRLPEYRAAGGVK